MERHLDPDAPVPGGDPSGFRLYLDVPPQGRARLVVVDHWTSHAVLVSAEQADEWVDAARVAEVTELVTREQPPARIWLAGEDIRLGPHCDWQPTYEILHDEFITISDRDP